MPASRFEAEVRVEPGLAVVAMRGDIDREAEAGLAAAYLAAAETDVIVLDFGAVGLHQQHRDCPDRPLPGRRPA